MRMTWEYPQPTASNVASIWAGGGLFSLRFSVYWMLSLLFLLFSLLINLSNADAPKHKENDKIDVYVNKIGPSGNPHETYHYYELPFCRPQQVVHKPLSLGQVMEGDRMAESAFNIHFGKNQTKVSLCGPKNISTKDVESLIKAIEEDYYFELFLDDIKVRQKIGNVVEQNVFPHRHQIFLYSTLLFKIKANKETILEVEILVGDKLELEGKKPLSLNLNYAVEWSSLNLPDSSRQIVLKNRFPKRATQVHTLSIAASGLSIILILACILGFIGNSVRRDLAKVHSQDDVFMETGWKVITTEVFRGPSWPMIHCAAVGVGCQFCCIFITLIVLSLLSFLDVHYHGAMNTISVVLYSITSGLAGFCSSVKYAQFGGKRWVANINVTSILFSLPMMIIWALNNTVFWSYQTTRALPWTTVLVLMSMWIVFGYPLTVIGGIIGRHFGGDYDAPCRSRLIPREIPNFGVTSSAAFSIILGGLIPFTSIIMEMPYAFQILWGRAHLDVDFLVLLTVMVLLISVACNSIALTYVQLNNEDYRWWWRSFLQGASIGVFIFGYGVYFLFNHSQMSGFVQLFEFFSHLLLLCYIVSLAMGAIAHLASRSFIWYLYNSMKND